MKEFQYGDDLKPKSMIPSKAELAQINASCTFFSFFSIYNFDGLVRSLLCRLCEQPRLSGINSATNQSQFFNVLATAKPSHGQFASFPYLIAYYNKVRHSCESRNPFSY